MRYSTSLLILAGSSTVAAFAPIASTANRQAAAVSQLTVPTPTTPQRTTTTTQLFESTGVSESGNAVDYDALLKYHGAIAIQMSIISALFFGLDTVVDATGIADSVPTLALAPIFYGLSLKSRVFNPLDNERPNMKQAIDGEDAPPSRGFGDRVMPSWTPPGVIFPIMWLLIIGPIRAYTSSLIWQANGHHFFDPAIMAFMFHLSVGDVWNTMNNTEQRFGASVTGVLCVTASALNAAYQYYGVDETAGHLLGLPMIWFAVAASLITATWQLNPSAVTGEPEPLYPVVRDTTVEGVRPTQFAWFGDSD